jgi:hypothetical protein
MAKLLLYLVWSYTMNNLQKRSNYAKRAIQTFLCLFKASRLLNLQVEHLFHLPLKLIVLVHSQSLSAGCSGDREAFPLGRLKAAGRVSGEAA